MVIVLMNCDKIEMVMKGKENGNISLLYRLGD